MANKVEYYEGCGRDGPIRCIFLCEFHPVAGPQILCQVPAEYVTKDVFEAVSVYVIPKAQLLHSVLTITVFDFKILGFPTRIDDKSYARNAFHFNVCFVFDSWARTAQYEPVVKKLMDHLKAVEVESKFLSQLQCPGKKKQLSDMLTQIMNDLNDRKMCILQDGNSVTYLKVVIPVKDPPEVHDFEVPVLKVKLESFYAEQWDLTTSQILPHINGVNHITKIAANADVDNNLVKSCIQNLLFYGLVTMVPIFQYSDTYVATPNLQKLISSLKYQEKCIRSVSRPGKQAASFRDIFRLYSSMRHGVTLKDLCAKYNPASNHIDERSLIQFGIVEGLIRKIRKYPILLEKEAASDTVNSQYYTGEYCTDEICCSTGMTLKELEEQIEKDPNVTFICK